MQVATPDHNAKHSVKVCTVDHLWFSNIFMTLATNCKYKITNLLITDCVLEIYVPIPRDPFNNNITLLQDTPPVLLLITMILPCPLIVIALRLCNSTIVVS